MVGTDHQVCRFSTCVSCCELAFPGFVVHGGFVGALIAALVIAVLGYVAEALLGSAYRLRAGVWLASSRLRS